MGDARSRRYQWYVHPHAVKRFVERVWPEFANDRPRALRELLSLVNGARFHDARENGAEEWRTTGERRCRLIVDPDRLTDGVPTVVTVLGLVGQSAREPRPMAKSRSALRSARIHRRRLAEAAWAQEED